MALRRARSWGVSAVAHALPRRHKRRFSTAKTTGLSRISSEADEIRSFLDGDWGARRGLLASSTTLYIILGPVDPWSNLGQQRLRHALETREDILQATHVDTEAGNAAALSSSAAARSAREHRPMSAMATVAHPYWNSAGRKVAQVSLSCQFMSRLLLYSFDSFFRLPEFLNGVNTAFYAVTSRVEELTALSGKAAGTAQQAHTLNEELRSMLDPSLFENIESAAHQQITPFLEAGGSVHHEIEVVGLPTVSHLCVVMGGLRESEVSPATYRAITYEASVSPLDGGFVVLVPHSHNFGQGLSSSFSTLHQGVQERGATMKVVINFDTREFLAVRDAEGTWSTSSFEPWQRRTRQWVFESPLVKEGSFVHPEWRVVDMDGILDGNAFWK